MAPGVHYDAAATAAYAVDKSTVRPLYVIEAARGHPLLHLDIKSAFTTETYRHEFPVYVRQMRRADNSFTHPQCPIGRLRLNLYGTKPACHIYHAGLDAHLRSLHYSRAEVDP